MAASPVLELIDVSLRLGVGAGAVQVLQGAGLSVLAGERVAVVGPSGSGKSSLIAVAAGLEPPSGGVVKLLGQDLARLGEDARARLRRGRVALVFQNFHLLPNMTAEENVAAPLELDHRRGATRVARDWLERVGLTSRARHYPRQLSGGEQQRVAIARAVANAPSLLLADEPTGNLDSSTGQGVLELLRDLNRERGLTMMLVTHDLTIAQQADRVVRLAEGRIEEWAPVLA
jgi:putative ABC transport system ATP-binding protein